MQRIRTLGKVLRGEKKTLRRERLEKITLLILIVATSFIDAKCMHSARTNITVLTVAGLG